MDITRGSLDGITKSSRKHQRQRPDSRVSLHSGQGSPVQRLESETRGSFEVLPPDSSLDYQECDLALEEYLTSSDDENGPTGEEKMTHHDAIQQLEQLILSRNKSRRSSPDSPKEDQLSGRSSRTPPNVGPSEPLQKDEDPDNEILKNIQDPKLRKAIRKMQKLDKILSEKIAREKEVKRQRATSHKLYQEELERIRLGLDRSEGKEESDNTLKFLALVPPSSHSEGDDDYAASPLFHTQPPDGGVLKGSQKNSSRSSPLSENSESSKATKDADVNSGKDTSRSSKSGPRRKSKAEINKDEINKDEDDFIRRNIQLASDAGNVVAMTDDEKKRLGELLKDMEMLGDEEMVPSEEVTGFELQMLPGVGFHPDKTEIEALKDLDNKLKALMPPESFQDICSTPSMLGNSFTGSGYTKEAFDLGERILKNNREARDHQDRLKQIEEELAQLQEQVENEISSPSLSKDELDDLFKQCDDVDSRTQSALSSPHTPRPTSSLQGRGDHDQRSSDHLDTSRSELSRDTLERLLDDAKRGLGYEETYIEGNIPEGINFGEDGDSVMSQNGESRHLDSRVSQISNLSRVPLVSHDIIQQLLKNPRATLLEATAPTVLNTVEASREEQSR